MAKRRVRTKRSGSSGGTEPLPNAPTPSQGRKFAITVAIVFGVVVALFLVLELIAP